MSKKKKRDSWSIKREGLKPFLKGLVNTLDIPVMVFNAGQWLGKKVSKKRRAYLCLIIAYAGKI